MTLLEKAFGLLIDFGVPVLKDELLGVEVIEVCDMAIFLISACVGTQAEIKTRTGQCGWYGLEGVSLDNKRGFLLVKKGKQVAIGPVFEAEDRRVS